tara:strand:+ start:951 stop:1088 length:138 start_codon:yes stop_codon:yes gene_type:complete
MELGSISVNRNGILVDEENIFGRRYEITGTFNFRHCKTIEWFIKI